MELISLFSGAGGLDLGFHKAVSELLRQMSLTLRFVRLSVQTFRK